MKLKNKYLKGCVFEIDAFLDVNEGELGIYENISVYLNGLAFLLLVKK